MGWCGYLLNRTKSVHIRAGKISEEDFMDAVDESKAFFDNISNDCYEVEFLSKIESKKLEKLTVKDNTFIFRLLDNYKSLIEDADIINIAAIVMYLQWFREGDKLDYAIDPDLTGRSEEL